jgi:RNA polymerase sigma-70 factor (ECF subfamily)
VRTAIAGDGEAFAELVARYRDAVYGVCHHRVGHPEEAKDLAQEAFLRAYLDLPQLRDPAAFPAWLRRVTERVCATWQRRKRLQVMSLDAVREPAVHTDADLPVAVRQAVANLSDEARLAVTLYYINGYSTRQVAEFLGVPAGTVKSRLHHARLRLKGELMDDYRDALRDAAPGPEFDGAVVRAVRSLQEAQSLPQAQRHGGPESEIGRAHV